MLYKFKMQLVKRKSDVVKIKIYCKWYNYNICEDCYYIKCAQNNNLKPISKP